MGITETLTVAMPQRGHNPIHRQAYAIASKSSGKQLAHAYTDPSDQVRESFGQGVHAQIHLKILSNCVPKLRCTLFILQMQYLHLQMGTHGKCCCSGDHEEGRAGGTACRSKLPT